MYNSSILWIMLSKIICLFFLIFNLLTVYIFFTPDYKFNLFNKKSLICNQWYSFFLVWLFSTFYIFLTNSNCHIHHFSFFFNFDLSRTLLLVSCSFFIILYQKLFKIKLAHLLLLLFKQISNRRTSTLVFPQLLYISFIDTRFLGYFSP